MSDMGEDYATDYTNYTDFFFEVVLMVASLRAGVAF